MSENAITMWILGIWAGTDLLVSLGFWAFILYKAEVYRRNHYPDREVTRDLLKSCRRNCNCGWLDATPFDEMGVALCCAFGPLALAVALGWGTLYLLFWLVRELMYFLLIKILGGKNAAVRQR